MSTLQLRDLTGGMAALDADTLDELGGRLRGSLLTPEAPDYDAVRAVWNGMIDRRPGLIVRCAGAADVMTAVSFARDRGLLVSVRGGGHHIAGNSVADDAMLIDLQPMTSVRVDPSARTAVVEPGALLSDVDRETQAFGLALPVGINSTTGIAGLTLGGGFGWLTRKYGMTIDHLRSADVVTADGELVRASADDNPDLFWAIRGGGGNFGIVTAFEFDLVEVGPQVVAGLIVYPFAEAREVLDGYREALAGAPEELSVWVVMRKAPPLPFLPESVHGQEVVVLALVHSGDADTAMADVEPFTRLGTPHGEHVGPAPLVAFQEAFDPLLTPGARNYWKSHDLAGLPDELFDVLVGAVGELPSAETEVFIAQLGGAMGRVPVADTAYAGREAQFVMNVHGRWRDAGEDDRCIAWCRRLFDEVATYAMGTAYVNFMTADEQSRVESAYGRNYERLLEVKESYDPDNFFRINQNLQPRGGSESGA